MLFSSKRGVSISIETLVKLLLCTAFLIIIIGLAFAVSKSLSNQGASKYACWMTSSLKASGSSLSGFFPSTCSARVIDEALDMGGVALLLRDTWWMYGHGKADYSRGITGMLHGDVWEAAKFKVSQEIKVVGLSEYLLTHRKGKASSMEASDYNYLQHDAKGSTVCFDLGFKDDDYKFKPNQEYHLYFADSSSFDFFKTDKLLVMKELRPRSYWDNKNSFFCYNPLTKIVGEGIIVSEAGLLGGGWVE